MSKKILLFLPLKDHFSTSHFKTPSQAQSLRWIKEANPRNPAVAGLLWLSSSIRLDLDPD